MARTKREHIEYGLAKRGARIYVSWFENGAKQRVSTGTSDSAQAKRFLADFKAGRERPVASAEPTIGEILDGYLSDRKGAVAAYATLEHAAAALKRHLGDMAWLLMNRERSLYYARRRRAEGYEVGPKGNRRTKPVSDGTITRELVTLRAAFRWAHGERWITDDPIITVPPAPPPREVWLSRHQAELLLAACIQGHVRLFVMLALHTAARSTAILSLTWDRVDLERGRIDLGRAVGRKGRAVVPINATLMEALVQARDAAAGDHVIESASGAPISSIKTGFNAACRRARLVGVTPHTLRHTAATWMAEAGVPMRDIALFLGHRDSTTTERVYAKYSPDWLDSAAEALAGGRKIMGPLAPLMPARSSIPRRLSTCSHVQNQWIRVGAVFW